MIPSLKRAARAADRRLRRSEPDWLVPGGATTVGLLMALSVGIPAPIILRELDVLPSIGTMVIVFFSVVGALYFGGLGAIAAGLGGRAARQ